VQDRKQRPIQVQQLLDALLGQIGVPGRSPDDLSMLPETVHWGILTYDVLYICRKS
jgi:hypothetical protein